MGFPVYRVFRLLRLPVVLVAVCVFFRSDRRHRAHPVPVLMLQFLYIIMEIKAMSQTTTRRCSIVPWGDAVRRLDNAAAPCDRTGYGKHATGTRQQPSRPIKIGKREKRKEKENSACMATIIQGRQTLRERQKKRGRSKK